MYLVFAQVKTDTMSSQRVKCPILSVPKLKLDPERQNGSKNVSWCEDKKVVDLFLKHNGDEGGTDDEFIEPASTKKIENGKDTLDQKESDLGLEVSSCIKWETGTFKKIKVESNDRNIDEKFDNDVIGPPAIKKESYNVNEITSQELNYGQDSPTRLETIKQDELHIKYEEDKQYKLNEKNINKEFDNDVKIITESGAIKRETDTEHAIAEELKFDSETAFQQESIQQEDFHIRSQEGERNKLNKKRRRRGSQLSVLHQCPECPYSTSHKYLLKLHSVRHKKPEEIKWYKCHECPYKTSQRGNLKRHAEIHNNNNETFKCLRCSYETSRPSNLKQHQIKHKTNIQWLRCPECSFKTHQPSRMQTHILAHKGDAFKCTYCLYQTGRKYRLAEHQIKHESLDKWHSCPLCPYKTFSRGVLKRHCLQRHSIDSNNPNQIRTFKCSECPYESGSIYSLKSHQLIHDQSSWLQCPDCVYKTPRKSDLKKHQVRHQGENTEGWLKCLDCPYKTMRKYDLRLHVISHKSGDQIQWFECSQCSFKSAYKKSLRQHQLKHKEEHEIEWFSCHECSFKTKRKSSLVYHISSSKHKKLPTKVIYNKIVESNFLLLLD